MLYDFSILAKRLTELGYPESTEHGFRIIRRDLTVEERAGNLEYQNGGIYLTVDGQSYKGYMYIKYADIAAFGYPKFHITNCKTILEQRNRGQFDGKYFWHNSNTVSIQDRTTGEQHENVKLDLCRNCKIQSNIRDYNSTDEFYGLLDQQDLEKINQEYEVDIFGYTKDWPRISKEYKKEKENTCESCNIKMEVPYDKRYIHVHHRNGDKLNNRRSNLQCLCVLCHSNVDETHRQNFKKRFLLSAKITFVNKYKSQLQDLGNSYINQN